MSTDFLEAAARIGRRICRDAVWSGQACGWLGDAMEPVDGQWMVVHRALGPEIYGGTAGIALLLARLHQLTGEPVLRRTALAALRASEAALPDIPAATRCSLYSGSLGIALAMLIVGRQCGAEEWSGKAIALLPDVSRADAGSGLDVVAGSAGAIAGLLDLARALPQAGLLEHARAHGQRLADAARRVDGRASWNTMEGQTSQDLTGFSHGTAGIAWALLELGTRTGQSAFTALAQQGFAYEQACFDPLQGNWPDYRTAPPGMASGGAPVYPVAWCHGAPGIGLSRLRAWQLTGDPARREEALAALRTTASYVTQTMMARYDCAPCHGHAGNLELMVVAATVLREPAWLEHARACAEALLRAHQDADWPCGVPNGGETPSLLLGLAGIAWLFLRLRDPEGTPSLLLPGGWTVGIA